MKYLTSILFLATSLSLNAANITCYKIPISDGPERTPKHTVLEETWCYWEKSNTQRLVFLYDDKQIYPEASAMILHNNNKIISLHHGSLNRGEVDHIEQETYFFNPFNIPLIPAQAMMKGLLNTQNINQEKLNNLEQFYSSQSNLAREAKITFNKNFENEEANLPDDKIPSTGYWWPHYDLPLCNKWPSPLHKYDKYVEARTGINPDSVKWEQTHHSLQHVPWGGHCNGWAASTILDGFFDKYLYDPKNDNMLITPSDIQGMRSEMAFCVSLAFYGKRFRKNSPPEEIADISPDRFHKILQYYIRDLQKPLITDYYAGDSVDNNIISAYKFEYSKDPNIENKYHVKSTITLRNYAFKLINKKIPASPVVKHYNYSLITDDNGNILSGEWEKNDYHPDFLWSPTAQIKCNRRENQKMHHNWINQMIRNLPRLKQKTNVLNHQISRKFRPTADNGNYTLDLDAYKFNKQYLSPVVTIKDLKCKPSSGNSYCFIYVYVRNTINNSEEIKTLTINKDSVSLTLDYGLNFRLEKIGIAGYFTEPTNESIDFSFTIEKIDYMTY